jgi:outer membrane protein insertion porin family
VIGDVSISERNLLGNGQFLRLRLAGSFERMQIDLSFTEPRFLDQNLSAGFDLFHKEIDMEDEAGYNTTRTGGTVRLGFPLSEDLWMQTGYTLEYATLDVDSNYEAKVSKVVTEEINNGADETLTSSIGTSLTFDRRNIPKNPTSGYYLQLATDMAGLGGDVQYVRVNAEGRYYYPISEKLTFVGRLTGGHIEGWGGDDVRLTDLYYRGGETIRGFDRGGFGPRDLSSPRKDALGGTTYWAGTAEVRFPLPFVPDDLGLSGAVFADAGSLFGANETAKRLGRLGEAGGGIELADDSSIRASVGASIMWQSPVGPIRMDFAKALMKESYDEEQFFRFGASTKF